MNWNSPMVMVVCGRREMLTKFPYILKSEILFQLELDHNTIWIQENKLIKGKFEQI